MQIDYALILSAGLGTRMGEIGKKTPKVLWPVFGILLIDLQIQYCRKFGAKKIYINTHFLAEKIQKHIEKKYKDEVYILHEDPLLDSGGAIHNLAKVVGYKGNLLTVNGDQLFLFDKNNIDRSLKELESARAVLFSLEVDKGSSYNETVSKENYLTEIRQSNKVEKYLTFSGVGLIKLDGLVPVPGISKFFNTVCNFNEEKIFLYRPITSEYWDFGTLDIYYKSHLTIYEQRNKKSKIIEFLKEAGLEIVGLDDFYSVEDKSIRFNKLLPFITESIVSEDLVCRVDVK
jgi:mannose-1-phosphate guanylyltransferase